jgi:hypothetical protein
MLESLESVPADVELRKRHRFLVKEGQAPAPGMAAFPLGSLLQSSGEELSSCRERLERASR